jgi:putative Ca2+/H+ antiporter (TMEM165/GDT1 family)
VEIETLVLSTIVVTLAEMGDKTQLLSFLLAAKLRRKVPIVLGILFATIANHYFAGYVGICFGSVCSTQTLKWIVALSFFFFAAWALKPDRLGEDRKLWGNGAFLTTLIAFFLVEMGDKTQLATVTLAMRYESLTAVVLGTTLGMMIANVPAVWMGDVLVQKVNMKFMRWISAGLFLLLGIVALLA